MAALLAALPLGPESLRSVAVAAADDSCADVIVYAVRGSGEAPKKPPGATHFDPKNPAAGYPDTWDAFDPLTEDDQSSIMADISLAESGTGTPVIWDVVDQVNSRVANQLQLSWSPIKYRALPTPADGAGWPDVTWVPSLRVQPIGA